MTVRELCKALEGIAPLETAAEWDNVGLLLGDEDSPVEKVMTCLTVTPEVVTEALAENADLIVCHHPVLFRAAKKLTSASSEGRLLLPLLRRGIAVYSPHTAFDNCPGGINDGLAKRMNLENVQPLRSKPMARECKLVAFVPDADLAKVSEALFAVGAGIIGHYEQCSFRLAGTGTFFGTANANPAVGAKGRREEVPEWKLEVVVPKAKLEAALAALRQAHSYEEPACDVYELLPTRHGGEGRIGDRAATPLADLARNLKASVKANGVQLIGDPRRMVRRVAVACGAAGEFLADAVRANADVFMTGELRFHELLAAQAAGLALLLPGHYASERPGIEDLAEKLAGDFPNLMVWPSRGERDPAAWL